MGRLIEENGQIFEEAEDYDSPLWDHTCEDCGETYVVTARVMLDRLHRCRPGS